MLNHTMKLCAEALEQSRPTLTVYKFFRKTYLLSIRFKLGFLEHTNGRVHKALTQYKLFICISSQVCPVRVSAYSSEQ